MNACEHNPMHRDSLAIELHPAIPAAAALPARPPLPFPAPRFFVDQTAGQDLVDDLLPAVAHRPTSMMTPFMVATGAGWNKYEPGLNSILSALSRATNS